jgi:hypothetical protein
MCAVSYCCRLNLRPWRHSLCCLAVPLSVEARDHVSSWLARICCVWLSERSCVVCYVMMVAVWSRVYCRLSCSASKQQLRWGGGLRWQHACAYCQVIILLQNVDQVWLHAGGMSRSLCGFCVVRGFCCVASYEACWFSCCAVHQRGWRACCDGTCNY